jgi:2-oxoisovalerate dehydrogenase E2 component (dihydrolipoyl transacylase)
LAIEQMMMPQLGESVTEGTISRWLIKIGDHVNKYDPIAEVLTDKVSAEIPSSFTGIITELFAAEDETLAIGEVICAIEVESDKTIEVKNLVEKHEESINTEKPNFSGAAKARYSPAVLKISREYGIDLSQVEGTGKEGRITRKNLLSLIEAGTFPKQGEHKTDVAEVSAPKMQPSVMQPSSSDRASMQAAGDLEVPVTGVRKAIAANMVKSKHEAPHAWMMVEVDATNLVSFRNSVKLEFIQKEGYNLTYFAFFVKAISQALTEFPEINSMWAGDKIIRKKDINIAIAVATDTALFVPVIKHADEKSIKGIARNIHELAQNVRTGKLHAEDMQGGTFTVNNTGSFGSIQSMGIINYPQAAILQVESIVKRPVIIDGMIAVRDMVNLCLSLDHRVLDGLICGKFLARIKEIIETMSAENTSIY